MREQFDKKLVDKIKSSFKELEEEYDASEWEKFSKMYFRKKPKPMVIWIKWFSGIAAAIILGITLNTLIKPIQQSADQVQNPIALTEEDNLEEKNAEGIDDQNSIPNLTDSGQPTKTDKSEDFGKNNNSANKTRLTSGILSTQKGLTKNNAFLAENATDPPSATQKLQEGGSISNTPKTSTNLIAEAEKEQMTEQEAIVKIEEWKGENTVALNEKEIKKDQYAKTPMKLGVLVAPQTISNSTQNINFGAGLMSEFSFSKRLKLDVGMAFARQNISPTSEGGYLMANVSNSLDATNLKASSFTGNVINSSREVSFGQLEIPLNLKYKVFEKKESDLYLISGVSNMVYLNQQDVTTFSTANIATSNFANSNQMIETYTQTVEPDSQGNGVDTGRMLNFGVGFEQNLKNGTFLSIEPFYKIALGNQTFTNQQFSIGGINLRMNFQLKNKKNTDD